jgi:CheY-like chemotaxis protein
LTACITDDVRLTAALTVLVVDDDADMRLLAATVLRRAGISVVGEAEDGPQALAELQRLDPPPVPTVVLLDNQMPGPTGLEVAAQIRHRLPNQLIILFSAFLNEQIIADAAELDILCVAKGEALELGAIIKRLVAGTV